jgi:4-hydroxybenzoate polyprenyltransferase
VGNFVALTDKTKLGKARFLEFYAEAHEIAFCKSNIQSGWKATGLYPKNRLKALSNR